MGHIRDGKEHTPGPERVKVASHRRKHPSARPTSPGLSFPTRGPTPTEVVVALALSLRGKLRTAFGS